MCLFLSCNNVSVSIRQIFLSCAHLPSNSSSIYLLLNHFCSSLPYLNLQHLWELLYNQQSWKYLQLQFIVFRNFHGTSFLYLQIIYECFLMKQVDDYLILPFNGYQIFILKYCGLLMMFMEIPHFCAIFVLLVFCPNS